MSFNNKKSTDQSIICGITGIICNLLLCIFKFVVGNLSGSVAVTADAANNLSDAGSNIITIFGSVLAKKPVDKEHPFGHGRAEYISAFIVAVLIILMSFEFGKDSVQRILSPQQINLKTVYIMVLAVSVAVKLFMTFFNGYAYKKTGNINLKAIKQDSLNDCISTSAVLICMIISYFTNIQRLDGIVGILVSIFILLSGINILKDIIGHLLGQPPSKETVEEIKQIMLAEKDIISVHDIIVHDYGSEKTIASAHAEMPSHLSAVELHDSIDHAEKIINSKLNILMCIHIDPVEIHNKQIALYKDLLQSIISELGEDYSFHDLKIAVKKDITKLSFELFIPFDKNISSDDIIKKIQTDLTFIDDTLNADITVRHKMM